MGEPASVHRQRLSLTMWKTKTNEETGRNNGKYEKVTKEKEEPT
jgi:hypothetical protein